MKEKLAAFLASFDGKPVVWGKDDCSACPHLWLRANGIYAHLPAYSSRDEAHALIDQAGGLVNVWDQCLAGTGIGERYSGRPELGDIAVIDTRKFGPVGVICAAGGVCAWRLGDGFFWIPPRSFLKVWAVS